MRITIRALCLLLSLLVLSAIAFAQQGGINGACKEDVQKLCPGISPGGGRIMRCLKDHMADVSPACKANIERAKDNSERKGGACKVDAEKFCKDVQPGGGRIMDCLQQHQKDLSPRCAEEMAERAQRSHRGLPTQ